jgi:hypothetical protein
MSLVPEHAAGETALIVTVPEAEPVVAGWRGLFDRSAAEGVPAHVTILYPFLPEHRIDAGVLRDLARLFAAHPTFDLAFPTVARFPGILYLAPAASAAKPLRTLTHAVAAHWPEAPPYGGRFPDVVPHLTVAQYQAERVLDIIARELRTRLPLTGHTDTVRLFTHDGTHWNERETFSLGRG